MSAASVHGLAHQVGRPLLAAALTLALCGCSVREMVVHQVGDALAQGSAAFSADDDPELIGAAAPFALKLIENLIVESPEHRGLLLAAARGFTQYSYAFVQQEAEEAEERSLDEAFHQQARARRLYRRARDYGLRGLALGRDGFVRQLHAEPRRAVATLTASDVALLYWTASSWAALIALSKDDPEALADLPVMEAMIDRALQLEESFDRGAIHTFLIAYETARQGGPGRPAERARAHFARAVELSGGKDAAPFIALAESVCLPQQRRAEFEALLSQALRIDVAQPSENRLANRVAQRRARRLLARADLLFLE
jgi:predicted anti-sigma-YlaC factor YlaD